MSRIDDLIAEHCPGGVPFCRLGDVASFRRGSTITRKEVLPGGIPVIAGGRSPAYFHIESNRDGSTVAVGGSGANAGFVSYWSQPIFVSDAFTVHPVETLLTPKYVYYFLKSKQSWIHDQKRGGGVPHVYGRDLEPMLIPVPPLEVQREIVRILDTFTELEAELEAELEGRRQQYEHYRDLAFKANYLYPVRPLGELVEILNGYAFKSNRYVDDGIRIIRISDVQKGSISDKDLRFYPLAAGEEVQRYMLTGGDLVLSLSGSVGRVAMLTPADVPSALNQRVACLRPKTDELLTRYLFHFLNRDAFEEAAVVASGGGTVKNLSTRWLAKYLVPIPPLSEQRTIARLLDTFHALVSEMSHGLPAELAARRKQYAYYRDRLLTFEEAGA